MEIEYRQGEKKDCAKLGEMIDIASGGVVDFLFHDLMEGMTPVQVVAHNLENDYYPHTYKSVILAEENEKVIGMALSYPSSLHGITDEMRAFFPADRLDHLRDYYSSRVENSWFIDALCVDESHRKRGVGGRLISLAKEKAAENGFDAVSLIAFADNTLAIPVYERAGFEVVRKIELKENEYIHHGQGCVLMKCDI